jgi:hypothetical protein
VSPLLSLNTIYDEGTESAEVATSDLYRSLNISSFLSGPGSGRNGNNERCMERESGVEDPYRTCTGTHQ